MEIDIYSLGRVTKLFLKLWVFREPYHTKWRKCRIMEQLYYKNYSKRASTTHPGGHKRNTETQETGQETPSIGEFQHENQSWSKQELSKAQMPASYQTNTSCWGLRLLGWYSMNQDKKLKKNKKTSRDKIGILWKVFLVTSGVKPTQYLRKKNNTIRQSNSLGLFCCFRIWMTCCNWWNREICFVPENLSHLVESVSRRTMIQNMLEDPLMNGLRLKKKEIVHSCLKTSKYIKIPPLFLTTKCCIT